MANKLKDFEISTFTGGINKFLGKRNIADNELPDMQNMDFVGLGGLKKRAGRIKAGTSIDDRVRGLAYFKTPSIRGWYRMSGTTLKNSSNGALTGMAYTSDLQTEFIQAQDKLYVMNGTDNLSFTSDGSTITEITANGNVGAIGIYYNQRLYCNNTTNPARLYFSGSGTSIGNFSSASPAYGGYIEFKPGSGAIIKGLARFQDDLYVWLEDSIYRVHPVSGSGTTNALDHTIELVSNMRGCVSHRSIDQVENDIFFFARDGVFSLGEVANYIEVRTTEMTSRIWPTIQAVSSDALARTAAVYSNHKYYLSLSDDGQDYNNKVLVWDTRYGGWLYWTNMNVNCWLEYIDANDARHIYYGSDTTGQTYEINVGSNDDGVAINAYFYTKCYDLKDFSQSKLFMDGEVLFGPIYGNVDIKVYVDEQILSRTLSIGTSSTYADGIGALEVGVFYIGGEQNTPESGTTTPTLQNDWRYFDIGYEGNTIQFFFQNKNLSEGFQVEKIQAAFIPFGHYKREDSKNIDTATSTTYNDNYWELDTSTDLEPKV